MMFAAAEGGGGGYGVTVADVDDALAHRGGRVDTGPCVG
jgi:hypothetical protein